MVCDAVFLPGELDEDGDEENPSAADYEAMAEQFRTKPWPEVFDGILAGGDEAVMRTDFGEDVMACCIYGLTGSARGWADDWAAFTKPWGFSVKDITVPSFLLHGEVDRFVPLAHGEWLAENIPSVAARFIPDQGHFPRTEAVYVQAFAELKQAVRTPI